MKRPILSSLTRDYRVIRDFRCETDTTGCRRDDSILENERKIFEEQSRDRIRRPVLHMNENVGSKVPLKVELERNQIFRFPRH